jgi:hypothetical protein
MTQHMVVESLRRQYLWIDGHFNELFVMIADDRGKDVLRAAYTGSRNNLWTARNGNFMEDDPATSLLYEALVRNQEQVEMLAATRETESLVDLIAIGVGLGSRLADCGRTAER